LEKRSRIERENIMKPNDYGLGDVVKSMTTAVGIKPCSGCQQRADALNAWSRRSFVGKALMAPFVLKASVLRTIAAATDDEVADALELVRTLDLIHVQIKSVVSNGDGTHSHIAGSRDAMLAFLKTQVDNADITTKEGQFLKTLDPYNANNEILAGWVYDLDVKPPVVMADGSKSKDFGPGYVLVLVEKSGPNIIISDQNGVIFRSQTKILQTAKETSNAASYPGAIPWTKFSDTVSLFEKSRTYLRSVKFRMKSSPQSGIFWCLHFSNNSQQYCYCQTLLADGGCQGFCVVGSISCPGCIGCYDSLCCPTGIGNNACIKHPGAPDCGWCIWANYDGQDCNACTVCTEVLGSPICCKCPIPSQCGCQQHGH
jgi:hypothetical protein